MHMMDTSCPVENLVTAASPYGGGYIPSAPTTKSAFLVVHGTHDNVVPYGNTWNEATRRASPTCGVNDPGFFNGFQEFNVNYINLFAETISAGVAKFRGYGGDVFGPPPAPSETLDLVDEGSYRASCEEVYNNCVNQYNQPSDWNQNFDCATLPAEETDVIDYPVSAGSNPVRLLRMNIHNHDYPNRRVVQWGPTEFFFYLRRFFRDNRRTRKPKTSQTIEFVGEEYCGSPFTLDGQPQVPENVFRRRVYQSAEEVEITPEFCAERCRLDEECVETFYIDFYPYGFSEKACDLHYGLLPCASTTMGGSPGRHYVTADAPSTPAPTYPPLGPTKAPTSRPTSVPTSAGFCPASSSLIPSNLAGYSCLEGLGDSNAGYTEEECDEDGGEWVAYDCATADSFWSSTGGWSWEYADTFGPAWAEQCCSNTGPPPAPTTTAPTPAATPSGFCPASSPLVGSNSAGFSCLDGLGDSNAGTTEADCDAAGGEWVEYDCATADSYWQSVGGWSWEYADPFGPAWAEQCCATTGPPPAPTTTAPTPGPGPDLAPGCPSLCAVPTCLWSGQDGPGWDPDWSSDEDGTPTENGLCTNYCKDYEPGKYLCGVSSWHQSGVDCSGCDGLAADPIIPPADRAPSSGLCAATEGLSGHILFGNSVRQCSNGPQPTNDDQCTVYQAFNGDTIVNPQRTCGGFCSSFNLACINGYDDGENGCVYGGPGIGCDDPLGVGSIGGPTPDHVCVCGPQVSLHVRCHALLCIRFSRFLA